MGLTSWQRRTATVFEACEYYTCHHTLDPQNEVTDVPSAAVQLVVLESQRSFAFFSKFLDFKISAYSGIYTKARFFQEF